MEGSHDPIPSKAVDELGPVSVIGDRMKDTAEGNLSQGARDADLRFAAGQEGKQKVHVGGHADQASIGHISLMNSALHIVSRWEVLAALLVSIDAVPLQTANVKKLVGFQALEALPVFDRRTV